MVRIYLYVFLLLMTLYPAAGGAASKPLRLALHWLPQAQFAGYYVALEKGFYREAGLNVHILPGGPDYVPANRLSSGEAHFATMFLSHALERWAAGIPVVNVSQLFQRSSLMLITRKKDNIRTIAELDQRRVAMWANEFQLQPWALFREHDIIVPIIQSNGSVELFLREAVPAVLAMWYNEYHVILSSGYREEELQPFFFKDTSFDFPEDGIYCLPETARMDPEAVQSLVSATLKGWQYTFEHEEEALDIVEARMNEANLPVSRVHQRWMLRVIKTVMTPKDKEGVYGQLDRQSYLSVAKTLGTAGFIHNLPAFEEFVWRPDAD
jgi:NitT/TauT family transport system substrate-binding protein